MERREGRRRLIVNADDFGRSVSINTAVLRAHREGILTSTSLMVNEAASDQAVLLAKENPSLAVGLHLTLLCGRSALPREMIPGLVNARREFSASPLVAGTRYCLYPSLRAQLRDEIAAQFDRFRATGLTLDHVNGHLHFHQHPVVFDLLMEHASAWGITRLRLTRDDYNLNARLVRGRWLYRLSHAAIHRWLSRRAQPLLAAKNIKHTGVVLGLLQDSQVDEAYVLKLLPALPAGDSELYSHPSLDQFRHELDALTSPRVRDELHRLGVELIRYQDL